MSKHLFGIIVTGHGTAANNRGETEGNITTLQKILWEGEVHTTVSAEAIRFAIRKFWQARGESNLNRTWNDSKALNEWADHEFKQWEGFLDDDVLGFMSAKAAKEDGSDTPEKKTGRTRGTVDKRRARLEVSRAVSLTPFAGDITFNAASPGATPSASSTGKDPVPYGTEVHATRYQYAFAITPESLEQPERAMDVVDALVTLPPVAGNHGRFLYDFAPESVVFRWTEDFAPRMLYAFQNGNGSGVVDAPALIRRVESGDIVPAELVVGGALADTPVGQALKERGAFVVPGVKAAAAEVKRLLTQNAGAQVR